MKLYTLDTVTAKELLERQLPPARFVVPGYLQEGLTILGGRPKVGKSWLSLNFALAVATGAHVLGQPTEVGDVLYLALEDHPRRLQDRLRVVVNGTGKPPRLHFTTACPAIGSGGIEAMEHWCRRVEHPRLIIVDVYARVRQRVSHATNLYDADYSGAVPLKSFADDRGPALLAVTHTRKEAATEDPLDAISATTGLAGAADAILVMSRDAKGSRIIGRGRDLAEDVDVALAFDRPTGRWRALGDREEVSRSDQRNAIVRALKEAGRPLGPKDIAEQAGVDHDVVRQLMLKLVQDGVIEKQSRGQYFYPIHSVHSVHQPPQPSSELSLVDQWREE